MAKPGYGDIAHWLLGVFFVMALGLAAFGDDDSSRHAERASSAQLGR